MRALLARYRGTEVKTTGDGFLATFDGPARAVKCAQGICEAVKILGIEVRAGCHTGEIELMGTDVGGIAVHIGAGSGHWPDLPRCSSRRPSRTSWPARAWPSRAWGVRLKGVPGLAPLRPGPIVEIVSSTHPSPANAGSQEGET